MFTQLPEDPAMLLSVVNTMLRNRYASPDELCEDLQADREKLTEKLKSIDYVYDAGLNQFV